MLSWIEAENSDEESGESSESESESDEDDDSIKSGESSKKYVFFQIFI